MNVVGAPKKLADARKARVPLLQLILFEAAGQRFVIDIMSVCEVCFIMEMVPIPKAPEYITGAINLRGTVVPVVDFRARIGRGGAQHGPDARIIIVRTGGRLAGLLVENVLGKVEVPQSAVEYEAPASGQTEENLVAGVCKTSENLLFIPDLEQVIMPGESKG